MQKTTTQKIRAFIVGDGEECEALKKYAAELSIDYEYGSEINRKASLHFTSWIKNIDEVNAGLDIVALSSNNEGTPVSLIEAQAAGKPIVSTKVGGVSNIVKPNRTALLVPTEDCESFCKELYKLIENKALREEMGSKGWDFVNKKYNYKRLVDDISKLYDELLQ
jgi:glycosyltransferase involved in cell wall biosynthesis